MIQLSESRRPKQPSNTGRVSIIRLLFFDSNHGLNNIPGCTAGGGEGLAVADMPSMTVSLVDAKGGDVPGTSTVAVDIRDDGPVLSLTHAGGENDTVLIDNSYVTRGSFMPEYGADGADGTNAITIRFEGVRSIRVNGVDQSTSFDETRTITFDENGVAEVYTGLGKMVFTQQADGSVSYTYLAKHGLQGDSEKLTFTATDADHDTASQSVNMTMNQDIPAGTSFVDEAGIPGLGSHYTGHGSNVDSFEVFLPEETTAIAWDLDAINGNILNGLKADVTGDGAYQDVVWQVGPDNVLQGMVGDTVVISVTPGSTVRPDGMGNHVSDFEVQLSYPVQHESGEGQNAQGL